MCDFVLRNIFLLLPQYVTPEIGTGYYAYYLNSYIDKLSD